MRAPPLLCRPDSLQLLAAKDTNRSHKILKSSRNLTAVILDAEQKHVLSVVEFFFFFFADSFIFFLMVVV